MSETAREIIKKARSLKEDLSKWDPNALDSVHYSSEVLPNVIVEQLSEAVSELAHAYHKLWPDLNEEYKFYRNDSRQLVVKILLENGITPGMPIL